MRTSEIKLPDLNGGINTHDPQYEIADNQSPDMLNLWFKDRALSKRDGQVLVFSELDGPVHRISEAYNEAQAVHAGEKQYCWAGDTISEIKDDLEDAQGVFVEFGDTLFYMDGKEIYKIDENYVVSAVVPYAPIVMINCSPDLIVSSDNESYNLIGTGFCVKYNGDGASAVYQLPKQDGEALGAAAVTVVVDAQDLIEGTHFTVNRTDATVNFSGGTSAHGAPSIGLNNVWITAYIDGETKSQITGCTVALPYGGESSGIDGGSRVFVMGNPAHPLCYWRSDLGLHQSYGMTYFPDTSVEVLDQNSESITAAAKMDGQLIIFKQRSIFAVGYAFDRQDVYYPVKECNSVIGCDMPGSVALIDNHLVFANTDSGVHMLISSSNALENTVKPLSANINRLLLQEDDLTNACACDHARYYWLCTGGKVYLWDYEQTPYYNYSDYEKAQKRLAWYRFDNIWAKDFYAGESLYYGGANGIVMFTPNKNDFGQAFESYFKTKAFDLGAPQTLKTFTHVYASFASDENVKVNLSVSSEYDHDYMSKEITLNSFNWNDFNWGLYTFGVVRYAKTFVMRPKMKKVSFIQITISSSDKARCGTEWTAYYVLFEQKDKEVII